MFPRQSIITIKENNFAKNKHYTLNDFVTNKQLISKHPQATTKPTHLQIFFINQNPTPPLYHPP